jgi:SHAQKYF class myb-like DNA-binding protein
LKVESPIGEEKKQDGPHIKRAHGGTIDEPSTKVARRSANDDDEWGEELHRKFAAAIFEIGLRNSSPAVILENMSQKPKSITSERVKSKLQKYRNNKEKSKQEFLEEYEAFLHRAKAIECAGVTPRGSSAAASLLEMMGAKKLLGGDAAAFLSYAVMKEQEVNAGDGDAAVLSTQILRKGALEYVENFAGAGIPFPELTEPEKKSSLGVSMTFVMGLFLSMTQHLKRERAMAENLVASGLNGVASNQELPADQRQDSLSETRPGSSKVSFLLGTTAQYAIQPNNGNAQLLSTPGPESGEETGEKHLNGSLEPTITEMI